MAKEFYPHTREFLNNKIRQCGRFNGICPQEQDLELIYDYLSKPRVSWDYAQHILWMLEEIGKMPPEKSDKAGRWIGWVLAYCEMMGLITNKDSRDLTRIDSAAGNV